jgi:hypothetical protein
VIDGPEAWVGRRTSVCDGFQENKASKIPIHD